MRLYVPTLTVVVLVTLATGCGERTNEVHTGCFDSNDCAPGFECSDGQCLSVRRDPSPSPSPFAPADSGTTTFDAGPGRVVDASTAPVDAGEDTGVDAGPPDAGTGTMMDAGTGTDASSSNDAGMPDSSTNGTGERGDPCLENSDCIPQLYCSGTGCSGPGTCQLRTLVCGAIYAPVCGCNGRTFSNRCTAAGFGVRVQATGECP